MYRVFSGKLFRLWISRNRMYCIECIGTLLNVYQSSVFCSFGFIFVDTHSWINDILEWLSKYFWKNIFKIVVQCIYQDVSLIRFLIETLNKEFIKSIVIPLFSRIHWNYTLFRLLTVLAHLVHMIVRSRLTEILYMFNFLIYTLLESLVTVTIPDSCD